MADVWSDPLETEKECLSAVLQRQPAYWKTGQVQAVPPDPVPVQYSGGKLFATYRADTV